MERKLGKHPPKYDPRNLKMARYLPVVPPPPPVSDWTVAVSKPWGDMMNADIGDCTCAAAGHMIMLWSATAADLIIPPDSCILEAYAAISGYDGTEMTDAGAAVLDVLKYWRTGGIAGHKILAFVGVDPRNEEQVKAALHLFGGVYAGVSMPDSWTEQIDAGQSWTWLAGDRPNQNNGHAIPIVGYDANQLTCITWGQKQPMSWEWFRNCCDELYAVLSPDWVAGPNAPSGLSIDELLNDLKAL